ncbi:MAG TPA: hypothetical protein VJ843_00480 [Candidatus Saccharimonadales bacterium]|nr:hypothetical protein [Candidatus Saccharimonadales bacterium]
MNEQETPGASKELQALLKLKDNQANFAIVMFNQIAATRAMLQVVLDLQSAIFQHTFSKEELMEICQDKFNYSYDIFQAEIVKQLEDAMKPDEEQEENETQKENS